MSTPVDQAGRHSLLHMFAIFFFIMTVHEGGHALMSGLLGYPVQQFVIGIGAPWLSFQVGPTEYGITPFLLGAYVMPAEDMPRIPSLLTILAGPLASIGILVFHPWSPLRNIRRTVQGVFRANGLRAAILSVLEPIFDLVNPHIEFKAPLTGMYRLKSSGNDWDVEKSDDPSSICGEIKLSGRKWSVEESVKKLKEKGALAADPPANPFTEESYLDCIPLISTLRFIRNSSFWMMSFILGVTNLLPFPPLDGAHILLRAASPTESDPVLVSTYWFLSILTLGYLVLVGPAISAVQLYKRRREYARRYAAPTLAA